MCDVPLTRIYLLLLTRRTDPRRPFSITAARVCVPSPALTVNSGDRIAQMVLERIATPEVTEVQVSQSMLRRTARPLSCPQTNMEYDSIQMQSLEKTIRGEGGFGHTGGFGAKTAAQ